MTLMTTFLKQKLSARISLMVVLSTGILLMLSLSVMLYYSRKAIKEEVLHKATHTLEGTVEHIDNTLLSVEQSAGIVYFNLMPYINNPEKVLHYCRELVEANSHVAGCAVASLVVHRRVVAAVIKGEPLPEPPAWHKGHPFLKKA